MSYVNEDATAGGLSNWLNAQIGITITLPSADTYNFTDYIRMSVNRTANYNVYHSVGKHNQGYIKLPRGYTFTVTIPVSSQDSQIFRMLFNSESLFTFVYADAHAKQIGSANAAFTEFKLIKEKLKNCILTSMNDSYEVEGIPMIVFNGTALSNDFVADISDTADFTDIEFGDNSTELKVSDLSGLVYTGYWDITSPPPAT